MSVLNYSGLETLWEHITSKFASINTVNDLKLSHDNLSDNFNNLEIWKASKFTPATDTTLEIFNGIASSVEIEDKSKNYVTGEIAIQGADNTLVHFGSNAQIINSTSATNGYTDLILGNSKASTATNSACGRIKLFGTGSGFVYITHSGTSSTNSYISFPEGGSSSSTPLTLATTQDVNGAKTELTTSIENQADAIETLSTTVSGKAPTSHASTATTYGVASADKYGHVKIGSNISVSSGTISVPIMTAATASAAGKVGLVPAPIAGNQSKFLRGDGTWATPTDTKVNTTLATTTKAYLLGTSTTPTSTATGVTSVADTGVYLTTTAGQLAVKNLLITDTEAHQHIQFSRTGYNYFSAPAESTVAFSFGTEAPNQGTSSLCINSTSLAPGTSNTISLGLSDKKWSNVYATTFTGSLSGNASTATALTSSAGSSSKPVYFSSGKPIQVDNIIIGSQSDNTERYFEVRRKNSSDNSYGRLHFSLSNTGSTAFIDFIHYDASGTADQENLFGISGTSFYPNATDSINLGISSKRWKTVYAETFAGTATQASKDGDGNTISSTYLKLIGGTMTGDLKIGSNSSTDGYYLRMQRAVGDTYYVSRFYTNGTSGAASIQTMKGTSAVNHMYLEEDRTVFKQPVNIGSGGTGASSRTGAWDNIVAGAGIFSGTPVIANASYYGSLWFNATKITSGGENRNGTIYAWTGTSTATDLSFTRFSFRQYSANANATTMSSVYEEFYLPKTTQGLSSGGSYDILTTKSAVKISEGGTNATTATDARANLNVPSRTGSGASGTWDINITGSAFGVSRSFARDDSNATNLVSIYDTNKTTLRGLIGFHNAGGDGTGSAYIIPYPATQDTWSGNEGLYIGKGILKLDGQQVLTAANYNNYSPTKTGTGASGTWGISISGTAATATALATSAGSSSHPIYFSGGKPVQVGNVWIGSATETTSRSFDIKRKNSSDASYGRINIGISSTGGTSFIEYLHYNTSGTEDQTNLLYISGNSFYPNTNTTNLGTSSKKWGTVYATTFNGSGASLTSLNASNISSGTLGTGNGGTGATTPSAARTNLGICGAITHGTTDPSGGSDGDIYFKHT